MATTQPELSRSEVAAPVYAELHPASLPLDPVGNAPEPRMALSQQTRASHGGVALIGP
jgi:hypothetical protein